MEVENGNSDAFIALAETLLKAGWRVVKFEDLGGAVMLTITPKTE